MHSPDEQALLAAVIAHPDEDTPRLIYADWLDENADSLSGRDPKEVRARAEFIRAQIEMARISPTAPNVEALRARIEKLELWHGAQWREGGAEVFFRGFPIAVRLDYLSEICGEAEWLLSRYPIQVLYANEAFIRDSDDKAAVASSRHFARLTGLGSTGRGWDGDRVVTVLTNPHLANLRMLDLFGGGYNGTDGALGIAVASHLTNLLVLELAGNQIRDEGLEALASAEHLTSLRAFRLGKDNSGAANDITEEGVQALARSPHFTSLTQLALDGNEVGTKGIEHLLKAEWISNLTELNLENAWIGEAGLMTLAHSGKLTNLRRLDVSANEVTEAVARTFLRPETFPDLVELHLISHHELEASLTEKTQEALRERFGPKVVGGWGISLTTVRIEDEIRRQMQQ